MKKLSLFDKIRILISVSKTSSWSFLVLLLLIIIGIIFFTTNKRTAQRNKKIYIILTGMIGIVVLIAYQSSINHLINYLMDNIWISIMFPNLAIYFLGIIITNIILWVSLFHFKTSNMIKKINIIVYIILSYFLVLLLKVIDVQKIDIFSQESLYYNEQSTALIELSSLLFIVWIIFLVLYKIILVYVRKDYKEKEQKVIIKQPVKILPKNYQPVETPKYLFGNPGKRITLIETNPKQLIQNYDNRLTLEEYQLLLKILKEEKEKKNKTKIMVEKEQIAAMKKQQRIREEEKYTELERLYRSIQ